jgi:DNA-binding PadR family transcriptional regulator
MPPNEEAPGRRGSSERRSRTRFVVLGMLTYGPASAYTLRKRIAASVGFFWQESYGQLFPTLARLEEDRLIQGQEVTAGRRRRRDYEITASGRDALAHWLDEPPMPQPERNELLLKVFFASEGGLEALRSHLVDTNARARAQLDVLHSIDSGLQAAFAEDPRMPFRLLTVRYGILGLEAFHRWSAEALRALDDRSPSVS